MIRRTVPGFPNYFAGLDGSIWSLKGNKYVFTL